MCQIQAALTTSVQALTAAAMLSLMIQVVMCFPLISKVDQYSLAQSLPVPSFHTAMVEYSRCNLRALYSQAKTVDNDRGTPPVRNHNGVLLLIRQLAHDRTLHHFLVCDIKFFFRGESSWLHADEQSPIYQPIIRLQ